MDIINQKQREKLFLKKLEKLAKKYDKIDLKLYDKYNVKRGLRNPDGSGVLVGLTSIGDVHGYIVDENEKIPVEGRLRYRGIDIKEIVDGIKKDKRFGFEEIAYLLLFGELPKKSQLSQFISMLSRKRDLPEGFTENMILKAPSKDIMNKLARSVLTLYSYDRNPEGRSIGNVIRQCIELIARFPVIVAYGYCAKIHYFDNKSLYIHNPLPELSTAENFLHLIRPDGKYTKIEAEVLDIAFVLHAEHGGGNNSTFSTHLITSADTDVYSAVASAIGSLKGLKRGGANIKVVKMMEEIKANVKDWSNEQKVADYLVKIIQRKAFDRTGLIYGMGHAVYTLSDPREKILREYAHKLAKEKGREDEFLLYRTVQKLGPKLLQEIKKTNKPICANVDFYSGFVYSVLGIPKELFTPLFAIARIAGWCAHIIEEKISGGRIIRPAFKDISPVRKYVPLSKR